MVKEILAKGFNSYIERVKKCEKIYLQLLDIIPKDFNEDVYYISDRETFNEIISVFGPALEQKNAKEDLMKVYDIGIHIKTKALIIANRGATLYSLSEKYEKPFLVRHIGLCVYMPGMGLEYVNAGLAGNVYDKEIVLRTESACAPSFLFGSQRCNCHYQWKNIKEIAANFNKIETPNITDGDEFENWVQEQYTYKDGKHIYNQKSDIGVVMLHLDSQNGMGSGFTKNEFAFDLTERASIRHRGEYTSEQVFKTTMLGGFKAIGLEGDPRGESDYLGYKVTPVVLDFLKVNKNIIMLTNNKGKINEMQNFGYSIKRIKSIGAVNVAGSTEATQRGTEFNHLDIDGSVVSFREDLDRIEEEIGKIIKGDLK